MSLRNLKAFRQASVCWTDRSVSKCQLGCVSVLEVHSTSNQAASAPFLAAELNRLVLVVASSGLVDQVCHYPSLEFRRPLMP